MSPEHLIDATIGTRTCGWAAGDGLKRGHGQNDLIRFWNKVNEGRSPETATQ
jgi:hypothetical protein